MIILKQGDIGQHANYFEGFKLIVHSAERGFAEAKEYLESFVQKTKLVDLRDIRRGWLVEMIFFSWGV